MGLAVQRAQDKTEQLQARAGALDELLASGGLEDATVPGGHRGHRDGSSQSARPAGHIVSVRSPRQRCPPDRLGEYRACPAFRPWCQRRPDQQRTLLGSNTRSLR